MNDRKWLNLVIFFISTMIILFLILQKKLDQSIPQQSQQPFEKLLAPSFKAELLVLNGRWVPVEQLNSERLADLLVAWTTIVPEVQLNKLPEEILEINAIELEWISRQQQKHQFILYQQPHGLIIQTMNSANMVVIYHYNQSQSQQLLPDRLIQLTNNNSRPRPNGVK